MGGHFDMAGMHSRLACACVHSTSIVNTRHLVHDLSCWSFSKQTLVLLYFLLLCSYLDIYELDPGKRMQDRYTCVIPVAVVDIWWSIWTPLQQTLQSKDVQSECNNRGRTDISFIYGQIRDHNLILGKTGGLFRVFQ